MEVDALLDGLTVEEIHGQNEERLNLMPLARCVIQGEEKQLKESSVGIDDVSCEGAPIDPSLIVKTRQEEMHGFKNAESIITFHKESMVSDSSRQSVDEYMPVDRIHSGKNVLDSGATFRLLLLERLSWWRKRTSDG